jgi:hypothetical protein
MGTGISVSLAPSRGRRDGGRECFDSIFESIDSVQKVLDCLVALALWQRLKAPFVIIQSRILTCVGEQGA